MKFNSGWRFVKGEGKVQVLSQ